MGSWVGSLEQEGRDMSCCYLIGEMSGVFWLSTSQHTPPPLHHIPNELSQMSSGPWSSALLIVFYLGLCVFRNQN